jgi:hypothetical protein
MTRRWPVLELRPDLWSQFTDDQLRCLLRKRGVRCIPSTTPREALITLLEVTAATLSGDEPSNPV